MKRNENEICLIRGSSDKKMIIMKKLIMKIVFEEDSISEI